MQVNMESVIAQIKCKPYKPIPSQEVDSLVQLLDLWLPQILPEVVKDDFIEFFISKIKGKAGWLRTITNSSFTTYKVQFGLGGYRGIADFILWDDKLDGHFLERMIPLLQAIAQCSNSPLSVEQFYSLAADLCLWTKFPLTTLDIEIITTLYQMPNITIPALARLLQTSYKKTRKRWNRLRRLDILHIQAIPNYPSIGLQPVLIELHDSHMELRSPYIVSMFELIGKGKRILYNMMVPEEQLRSVSKFLTEKLGNAHTLFIVNNLGHTAAFTHYHQDEGIWRINWNKLFIGAHLLYTGQQRDWCKHYFEKPKPAPYLYILDEIDQRLIPVLMTDARMKLEKLAKIAGMSISQVSRRKSNLMESDILRLKPMVRRVGLVEDIVIRIKRDDPRLLGIVGELPQAWTAQLTEYNSGDREILVYATLPAGSFTKMRYYISKYLQTCSEIFTSGPESGGWPLNFEIYDTKQGLWTWQELEITEWKSEPAFLLKTSRPFDRPQELVPGRM